VRPEGLARSGQALSDGLPCLGPSPISSARPNCKQKLPEWRDFSQGASATHYFTASMFRLTGVPIGKVGHWPVKEEMGEADDKASSAVTPLSRVQ